MYLVQTVQTSWRPQLPLPKDSSDKTTEMNKSSHKKSTDSSGKWSLGRLFKKKKEQEPDSSSEEDRKAGFSPSHKPMRKKDKRSSRTGFDHIVSPNQDQKYNSLERKAQIKGQSSEEEASVDLSAKYRSDESFGSAQYGNMNSRRSRSARNERYYKRLSRDGEVSIVQPLPPTPHQPHRFKTQPVPLSVFNGAPQRPPATYLQQPPPKNLQNGIGNHKKSISYDNYIHLHNLQRQQEQHLQQHHHHHAHPPPPPPRDPLRRVHMGSVELRPNSYSEQTPPPSTMYSKMNGRCVSDDKLWNSHLSTIPHYHRPSSTQPPPTHHKRYISRAENPRPDFKYITESAPRSRKPISIVDDNQYVNSPVRTSKSGLTRSSEQQYAVPHKPEIRSTSTPRAGEYKTPRLSLYSSMTAKPQRPTKSVDEVDFVNNNVVNGNLQIRPSTKSNSMPNYYHKKVPERTPYDAERKIREIFKKPSPQAIQRISPPKVIGSKTNSRTFVSPPRNEVAPPRNVISPDRNVVTQPRNVINPQRNVISPPRNVISPPRNFVSPPRTLEDGALNNNNEFKKKERNLDDAINELEAIYKSLKLVEEKPQDPEGFEEYAARADEYLEDEDSPSGEPDTVKDDLAYRSIKHANSMLKTAEKQPPFGIPLMPIPSSPRSDYLNVKTDKTIKELSGVPHYYPDVITDDLAVRALRKDQGNVDYMNNSYSLPLECQKKKRATRTQSANIYNLIHRDSAKPSGGNLKDYFGSNRNLDKSGSMSDIYNGNDAVELLKALNHKEESPKHIPFRHPSQGGAIMNLPNVLQPKPTPLPRKSITPEIDPEALLGKIAQEARQSSEKFSKDLEELRRQEPPPPPPRRLPSEEDLLDAIEQVSEAANKISEKLRNDLEPTSPKSVDLVIPSFLQKLDPSSQEIGEIAARCMRQISELDDFESLGTVCNKSETVDHAVNSEPLCSVPGETKPAEINSEEDEIEKIMRECEEQVNAAKAATAAAKSQDENSTTETGGEIFFSLEDRTSFTSSSDCLKSSSPTNRQRFQSSSITSFNPYSSSDYVKSPSSDFHLPSTDPIKTFSTTSYDVQSTPNQFTSPFGSSSDASSALLKSDYNSADELSTIFTSTSTPIESTIKSDDKPKVLETGKEDLSSLSLSTDASSNNNSCSEFDVASANLPHVNNIKPSSSKTVTFNLNPIYEDDSDSCSESLEEEISELYVKPQYSSNISIIVSSPPPEDDDDCPTQLDSLSSNEDSGNSSLSDFPAVKNRFKVTLDHNSKFQMKPEFVSEVTIPREEPTPSTSSSSNDNKTSSALTIFAQPSSQNGGLTFLENLALACTVGVINNEDLLTLLAIFIAIITIVAFLIM
ncbi:hypothetical protein ACFFRR_010891 [Megaselia abdita]